MLFGNDRSAMRRMFVQAWHKSLQGLPCEPLEQQISAVIRLHPEYHALLQNPDTVEHDYAVEDGQTNPFLHMGMHLAIREQLATDRPHGLNAAYRRLLLRHTDEHRVEHELMECLGRILWEAQGSGREPDSQAYLECVLARL